MKDEQLNLRIDGLLAEEKLENKEKIFWMSFCDTDKPQGEQFLGVIITKSLGHAHAIQKTHELGINPNGEIKSYEVDKGCTDGFVYDTLLSKEMLKDLNLI